MFKVPTCLLWLLAKKVPVFDAGTNASHDVNQV